MPVAVLVRQILAVSTNRFFAFLAGVGIKIFIAFDTVGAVLLQDVLLTKQRLFAVVAVKAFSHGGVCSPAILAAAQCCLCSGVCERQRTGQTCLSRIAQTTCFIMRQLGIRASGEL